MRSFPAALTIIFVIGASACLFSPLTVQADILQPDYSSYDNSACNDPSCSPRIANVLIHLGTGITGTFSSISYKMGEFSGYIAASKDVVLLQANVDTIGGAGWNYANGDPGNEWVLGLSPDSVMHDFTDTLASPFSADPSKYYFLNIGIIQSNSGFPDIRIFGNLNSSYHYVEDRPYSGSSYYSSQLSAFYLSMPGVTGGNSFLPPSSISIDSPTDYSTSTDFSDWTISYSNSTTTNRVIIYLYDYTAHDAGITPYTWSSSYPYTALPPTYTGTLTLPKDFSLSQGQYAAQAFLYAYPGMPFATSATSSLVHFYITATGTPGSGGTPPEAPPIVSCGGTDWVCQMENWFTINIETILAHLFEPASYPGNQFAALGETIKTKAPWGYIPILVDVFNGLGSSGTSSATIMDLSALSSITEPIDVMLSALVFFLFGWFVVHRISRTEL